MGERVERIVLADDHAEGVDGGHRRGRPGPAARSFAQTVLTAGARRQRIETRINHPGAHANVRLDGVYLLDGQRHADLTTVGRPTPASTGPPAS